MSIPADSEAYREELLPAEERNSSAQVLEEIHWGDDVIPVDGEVTLGFDITQYFVDYAFYPWVKDNWAAGFGLGFRFMEIQASLAWTGEERDLEDAPASHSPAPAHRVRTRGSGAGAV